MKRMLGALVLVLSMSFPQASAAQGAPPPFGHWVGQNTGDFIILNVSSECSVGGMVNVSGRCLWNPTSNGGVLTMVYYWVTDEPAYIHWSIVCVDNDTLLINGVETFVRIG